jgi:hypothetical protein
MGPSSQGFAQLSVVPGDLFTATDEADLSVVVNASDVRSRQTGSDYDPSAGTDVSLIPRLRVSDTYNGSPAARPATTSDFDFPVPISCTATADPAVGSTCNLSSSLDAVNAGAIKEGRKTAVSTWKLWLFDAGNNATRGDADDKQFAQQGIYVP